MKKYIYLLIMVLFVVSYNTDAQNIAFNYDADGNMESRYVVMLQSAPQYMKEGEYAKEEEKEDFPDVVSTELTGQKITVSPNPTRGEICIEISFLKQNEENFICLFDMSGLLIETRKIVSEHTYLEISGNPGVYLLNIHLGKNISKWKIIKQ